MKYAIVIDGKVDNLIELEPKSDFTPQEGELVKIKANQQVSMGWLYKNGKFTDPDPQEPEKPVAEAKSTSK